MVCVFYYTLYVTLNAVQSCSETFEDIFKRPFLHGIGQKFVKYTIYLKLKLSIQELFKAQF